MADRERAPGSGDVVVVTGCAGLIGSHLADALLERGDRVIGLDVFNTGQRTNVDRLLTRDHFRFVEADVNDDVWMRQIDEFDSLVHLASPASPTDFPRRPLEILRTGSVGTFNTAGLAAERGARYLLASTSQVYGDPQVHPQPESYTGNVSTTGPRSCYDEAKRFAEATVAAYVRSQGLDAGIARIFNTYGPRMRPDDGRSVVNFVVRALADEPLIVHGDGMQTRSFCFVDDTVRGLLALLDSGRFGPFNLGNPEEITVLELAKCVLELTGSSSSVEHQPLPQDDPCQRRPDISAAVEQLGWGPRVPIREGLVPVIEYFRQH